MLYSTVFLMFFSFLSPFFFFFYCYGDHPDLHSFPTRRSSDLNHRFGLYDAILLKENHIALAGGIKEALDKAHTYASPKLPPPRAASAYDAAGLDPEVVGPGPLSVQIEVRDERELREALEAGAELVLLDNMT